MFVSAEYINFLPFTAHRRETTPPLPLSFSYHPVLHSQTGAVSKANLVDSTRIIFELATHRCVCVREVVRLESITPRTTTGMARVYPNVAPTTTITPDEKQQLFNSMSANNALDEDHAVVLTVWKKSLLFNCHGFTVYDGKGNLVFRVDNYMATSGNNGEIVLMDAAGKPLLTIRRKRLSLGDNWLVYEGETAINPRFLVKKHVNIINTKYLAHVGPASGSNKNVMYEIEGSYAQRCCAVFDEKKRRVAEIKKKESVGGVAFGVDVFRLIVDPEMDTSVAMAMVILLDQMFGSTRRFST